MRTTWEQETYTVGPLPVFVVGSAEEVQAAVGVFIASANPSVILALLDRLDSLETAARSVLTAFDDDDFWSASDAVEALRQALETDELHS